MRKVVAAVLAFFAILMFSYAIMRVPMVAIVSNQNVFWDQPPNFEREQVSQAMGEAVSELVVDKLQQRAEILGLPQVRVYDTVLVTAVADLAPDDWLDQQLEVAIPVYYATLDSEQSENVEFRIDIASLLANLQRERGWEAVGYVVSWMPDCFTKPYPDLENGQPPFCVSENDGRNAIVERAYPVVLKIAEENPALGDDIVITSAELNPIVTATLKGNGFFRALTAQQRFDNMYKWVWLLWLLPIICMLLIVWLVRRPYERKSWKIWCGVTLVATAVLVLFLTQYAPEILSIAAYIASESVAGTLGPIVLQPLLTEKLYSIQSIWLRWVFVQVVGFFLIGLLLIIAIPSMRRASVGQ